MSSIKEEFEAYRRMVIHPHAPQIQIKECEKAFYSGALAFYTLVMKNLAEGNEPTSEDLVMMRRLHNELVEFGKRTIPAANKTSN
jgi:hypothetical protein